MYKLMIFLHILGVILFFGNLMIAFFLMMRIGKETPLQVVRHSLQMVNAADKWLTTISVILILASGVAAALMAGIPIFGTEWIIWSLIVFGISGLLFVVRVLPLQLRMEKAAENMVMLKSNENSQLYSDLKRWKRWAGLASTAAFMAIILMVFGP